MSGEHPENRADDVRYSPRAVEDDDWITAFLTQQPTCVLGLVDEGSPYVVNQLFVYDPTEYAIYLHGAITGKTRTIVEQSDSPDASLTVSRMGRLLPAENPVDFDVEYASVVGYGEISLVVDSDQKRRALELLMAKFAPHLTSGEDYNPIAESSIERTSVYRVDIEGWSAKRNEMEEAFTGAYDFTGGESTENRE
ncbi:pyridoxamine 5'-phosphate oxidase family protein [Haloferax sp. DFSO52]|uniref:pyridoxamine 5'-phosphate oxidase family protein n=1 Tax=Haloferax sp. DFSO52 TaxID=3388505 RepID=UPI003A866CE7